MRAPWHLWVVGLLSLLWNAMGAFDYVMTQTRTDWYMSNFSEAQLAYFYSFPAWSVACWALGVWGAVAGSLLLLVRSRLALWAFLVALAGIAGTSLWQFVLSPASAVELMGQAGVWFSAAIVLVTVLLFVYARAMKMRGVLR